MSETIDLFLLPLILDVRGLEVAGLNTSSVSNRLSFFLAGLLILTRPTRRTWYDHCGRRMRLENIEIAEYTYFAHLCFGTFEYTTGPRVRVDSSLLADNGIGLPESNLLSSLVSRTI